MTKYLSDDILDSWKRLLQEIKLSKSYYRVYLLYGLGTTRNPILDNLLPSLLYIKMVSIIDEALDFYINYKDLTMPKKYRSQKLKGKIEFLNNQRLLINPTELQKVRDKRNDIAHDITKKVTWDELDNDLNVIENELRNLGFIGDRPKYEFYAERSEMRWSKKEPGILGERDFCFGLKREGKWTVKISWTEKLSTQEKAIKYK